MPKKYTQETFLEKAREVHGDKYDFSDFQYTNSITKGVCKCNICSNVWETRPDVLLRGHGCPKCYHKKNADIKRIPFDEIQNRINNIVLNKGTYIDTHHSCECKCTVCGHIWHPRIADLLKGHGCPKCAIERSKKPRIDKDFKEEKHDDKPKIIDRKPLIERFLRRAKEKFGDRFIYNNIDEYENKYSKLSITCTEHNETFQITARKHLEQQFGGCRSCLQENGKRITLQKWLEHCKEIHNGYYDYSKVESLGGDFDFYGKVDIRCKKHGWFQQVACNHYHGKGCDKCAHETVANARRITEEQFVKRANAKHKGFYIYDDLRYQGLKEEVYIICPIHGEFIQVAKDHLDGCGCPKCGIEKAREARLITQEEAIMKARLIHGDKYDYSEMEYNGMNNFVYPICPIHGKFRQLASLHILNGGGCPKCSESKLERAVRLALEQHNVEYDYEKTFDWLTFKSSLSLDFYLPQYNIAIECQGGQHFVDVERFGGEASFIKTKQRDERKRELCKANGVELVYFLEDKYEEYVKELDNKYFIDIESLIGYIRDKESSSVEDLLLEAQ